MVQAKKDSDKGKLAEAGASFEKAIALDPTNLYGLRCLAQTDWRRGKTRKAIAALKTAVAANPHDLQLHLQLGKCQARRGNFLAAAQTAYAICSLPKSDEVNKYFAEADRTWPYARLILLLGAGLTLLIVGGLLWKKRRR